MNDLVLLLQNLRNFLVGLPFEDALKILNEHGTSKIQFIHAERIDGVGQMTPYDFRTERVNVWVDDGVISKVVSIG